MFKKGLLLSIIFVLIFSVVGYAFDYKYTQESGTGFFVGTADKSDALEDCNELRQIINDLGTLLDHSKMDGLYPKDLTTGGTIQIPEAGLKFSNAPVNDDIAAYIAGEMTWQTKAELGIDLSLYYLKTEIDTLSEVEAIYIKDIIDSDELAALKFTDLTDTPANYTDQAGKYVKVNAGETALEFGTPTGGAVTTSGTPVQYDYARFTDATTIEGRSYAEMKTDLSFMTDLVDDITPQLGGQLQSGAHSINFTEQVLTSGTAIAWNLGNSNKATLTAAHNFTITITAPSGALNAQLIVTQDGTGSRVMDEIVTQKDEAIATTDVNTTTEEITVTVDIPTGARIRFKTTAADLPAPLVVDTIYYAIRISATVIKVATTKANAHAGTAIDLTDQGTGTHTVQQLVKWTDGTLEVLSTAAGSEDILGLTYKTGDKQWYAQLSKNFK